MGHVLRLVEEGWSLVITHGNGPQVGHILIRSEAAAGKAYAIPLSVAVAESEGEIGYVIQQSLYNELAAHRISRPIVTVLTQVLVDRRDPAFASPTKPIGPFLSDAEVPRRRRKGATFAHFPGYGWRRIVPSPRPLEIIEGQTVRRLAEEDVIVIAAGGGGIPVYKVRGRLHGVDAVIDKDLASSVLAKDVGAELLLLLTDVRKVALDYGKPTQVDLASMTVAQAREYLAAGHFPERILPRWIARRPMPDVMSPRTLSQPDWRRNVKYSCPMPSVWPSRHPFRSTRLAQEKFPTPNWLPWCARYLNCAPMA